MSETLAPATVDPRWLGDCYGDCASDCYDCEQNRKAQEPCDDCFDHGYTIEAGNAYACGGSCDTKLVKSIARVELRLARARSHRVAVVLDKHLSALQRLVTTMPELPDLRPSVVALEACSAQLMAEAKREVIHTCPCCGDTHTREDLKSLRYVGPMGALDLYDCKCASTFSIVRERGAA